MINHPNWRNQALSQLSDLMAVRTPRALVPQMRLDRYLSASLLQKAIRRGEHGHAWSAASYLIERFSEYFWRRLPVIALEDVGLANLNLVELVLAASSEPFIRARIGDSIDVASMLVELLCNSPKDRSTDDLYDVLTRDPEAIEVRVRLLEGLSNAQLTSTNRRVEGVIIDAAKLAVLAGVDGEIPAMGLGKRKWQSAMESFEAEAHLPLAGQVAQLGLQVTGCILAPMMLPPALEMSADRATIDDPIEEPTEQADVPLWALGMHTRVGLDGFRRYLSKSAKMAAVVREHASGDVSASKTVGGLVFRIDCGQLRKRMNWPVSNSLRARATSLGWGLPDEIVPDALDILHSEYDLLSKCRAAALQDYFK